MPGAGDDMPVDSLPSFERPPVIEVVLGVEFQPIPRLGAVALSKFAARWRAGYPTVQEHPALPSAPPVGFVGDVAGMVVNVGAPAIRLWLLSTAGDSLVQVQRDRLVLNWRRGDAEQEYPHYDHLRPTYAAVYEDLQTFLAEEDFETVRPTAVEVTYVNSIEVTPAELPRAVRSLAHVAHPLGAPTETQLAQTWAGTHGSTLPSMLTMTVNRSPLNEESVLLTLSSRSAVAASDPERVFDAMEQGHRDVVLSFDAVTTDEMHTRWGRQS